MMGVRCVVLQILCVVLVDAVVIERNIEDTNTSIELRNGLDNIFNGVYAECFLHMSYTCLQKRTLLYLKELNNLSEVSIIGDLIKFVKINVSSKVEDLNKAGINETNNSDELAFMIDKAVDNFFNNHILKFSALGSDVSMTNNVEEFVGRKKRKGGGGGDHGGDHDFGKKKMMMMAMMCMKMKLMMMVPAMMGMMGMMSFKGMMFSMMSFMISKMMLLMKLLEKKGNGAGFGGAGGSSDGLWAASAGGGGAWMPAGAQDYGGGGYDSNAQWQSRSIFELNERNKPSIDYVAPNRRHKVKDAINDKAAAQNLNEVKSDKITDKPKSRKRRDIIDILQNSYAYWINRLFGASYRRRNNASLPKYKTVNGIRYVFHPYRAIQKVKAVKDSSNSKLKTIDEGFKPIITADDFNKGEIFEGAIESRMNRKKLHKMKDAVNDTVEDNPWE